ncbi:MAG TPA: hypothetical protein VK893_02675 [Pyrinomonadaceae bacterium]|nr:hypothetical protein [Pyrinomonadaceae bacterium]
MKRILIVILLVVLAGVAGVVVRSSSSDSGTIAELRELTSHRAQAATTDVIRQTYPLSPGARVEVAGINGRVTIETSPDTKMADLEIERTASSQEALERRKIKIESDGNSLRIHGETVEHNLVAKLFGSKASEKVTLKLPAQVALFVKGVNGPLVVGAIDGAIEVEGVNGKVHVANAAGSASFKGINGHVVAGLKSIEQGGVTLKGINGSIELQLPANLNADFEATGMNGRVISDIPNVVVDKHKRGNYWARIGSGGKGISAKGINGNIRLTFATATATATIPAADSTRK